MHLRCSRTDSVQTRAPQITVIVYISHTFPMVLYPKLVESVLWQPIQSLSLHELSNMVFTSLDKANRYCLPSWNDVYSIPSSSQVFVIKPRRERTCAHSCFPTIPRLRFSFLFPSFSLFCSPFALFRSFSFFILSTVLGLLFGSLHYPS